MNTSNITLSQQVQACYCALQGNGLALDIVRDWAMTLDMQYFNDAVSMVRVEIARNNGLSENTALGRLVALKCKGASTLNVYSIGFRKMIAKGDGLAIANARASDLNPNSQKKNKSTPAAAPAAAPTEDKGITLTLGDMVRIVCDAGMAGTLTPEQCAMLRASITVPTVEPVKLAIAA